MLNRRRAIRSMSAMALLALSCVAADANSTINALWNDGNGFGIWLFGRDANCSPSGYKDSPFFVVGNGGKRSETGDGKYSASDLKVCLAVTKSGPNLCKSGYVRLQFAPATNEYVGDYDLTTADGTRWTGPFRAQYCKGS